MSTLKRKYNRLVSNLLKLKIAGLKWGKTSYEVFVLQGGGVFNCHAL